MIYEIKRILGGKNILILGLGYLLFIGLTLVNALLIQPFFSSNNAFVIDYYNAVSQCLPFVYAPIVGSFFAKDFEKRTIRFYSCFDVNIYHYILRRLTSYLLVGSTVIFFEGMLFLLFVGVSPLLAFQVTIMILLNFLYFLLISSVLSSFFKNRLHTVFSIMGVTVVLSILNIVPIPAVGGHLFLLDANSQLNSLVNQFFNEGTVKLGAIILLQLIGIAIMFILLIAKIAMEDYTNEKKFS